jgi:hypothetical protein
MRLTPEPLRQQRWLKVGDFTRVKGFVFCGNRLHERCDIGLEAGMLKAYF